MDQYEQDNIIEWIFEKAFDQLTLECNEIAMSPFSKIQLKTFDNPFLYLLINKLSNRSTEQVKIYLTNRQFQERFLFNKLKKKLDVQILLDNLDQIKYLLNYGYKINNKCLHLIVINNRLDILKYLIETNKIKLYNELLMYCVEFGYEEMYFFLKEKRLTPNISIFNKAVLGDSINIIQDINRYIGLSEKILTSAFQRNNTNIILYLISQTSQEKIRINQNLMTYPIMNNNMKLLLELDNMGLVNWHSEFYYSAILSGSITMVKYIESKIPNIHDNHILDTSRSKKKGQMSLLIGDMIYEINKKNYFSHTINYAIQSNSLEMVNYLYSLGYGITPSNFITAIKQSNTEILEYLCQNYHNALPFYLIHYFGINSYVPDKIIKAKILFKYGLLDIELINKLNISDYQKEAVHIQMISETIQVSEDGIFDIDYLMKYQLFFVPVKGYKLNYLLLTKTRICLELNLEPELERIISSNLNFVDKQIIVDALYLFGNIDQIKKLHSLISISICPSQQIIMEMICYCQIGKLCYLINNNLLKKNIFQNIYPIITMLSDTNLNAFSKKIGINIIDPKFIVLSGKKELITKWLEDNPNYQSLDKKFYKNLLQLENVTIIGKIKIPVNFLEELIIWCEESDLLEIANFLKTEYRVLINS